MLHSEETERQTVERREDPYILVLLTLSISCFYFLNSFVLYLCSVSFWVCLGSLIDGASFFLPASLILYTLLSLYSTISYGSQEIEVPSNFDVSWGVVHLSAIAVLAHLVWYFFSNRTPYYNPRAEDRVKIICKILRIAFVPLAIVVTASTWMFLHIYEGSMFKCLVTTSTQTIFFVVCFGSSKAMTTTLRKWMILVAEAIVCYVIHVLLFKFYQAPLFDYIALAITSLVVAMVTESYLREMLTPVRLEPVSESLGHKD